MIQDKGISVEIAFVKVSGALDWPVIDELHIEADGRRTVALAAVGPVGRNRHQRCDLLCRITDDGIDVDGRFLVVLLQEQSFPRDGKLILVFLDEHRVPEAAELKENDCTGSKPRAVIAAAASSCVSKPSP